MLRHLIPVVALFCSITLYGDPIVYSNLEPTDALAEIGYPVFGTGTGLPPPSKFATSFTAHSDFTVDAVRVGLYAYNTPMWGNVTTVTAHLFAGTALAPTTLLGSSTISGIASPFIYTLSPSIYTFDFADNISFSAGEHVWVALTNATSVLIWAVNRNGIPGVQQNSASTDLNIWGMGSLASEQASLEVLGVESTAVPEGASAAFLMLTSVGTMAAFHCRHRRTSRRL